MSRKLLAFLFSELSIVRLICRKAGCGGVIETPIERLAQPQFDRPHCPVCNSLMLNAHPDGNPLMMLAKASAMAKGLQGSMEIEFVLPDENA